MEKCRRTKRQRCMSKNWIPSWLWKSSKTRQQYCRSESFAMKTDIPINGSIVRKSISLKTGFGYPATRRNSFLLWFPDLSSSSSGSSSTSRTLSRQESHYSTVFFQLVFVTYSKWNSVSRTRGSNWEWHLSSTCVNYDWWKIGTTWR